MTERQIEYQEYLKTEHWQSVAKAVKERAGFRCQVCNNSKSLEAHHRTYEHMGREAEFLGDLICLCRRCHGLFHASKKPPASPRPQKPRTEQRKHQRFFRKAAQKLMINQNALAEMGRIKVKQMLEAHASHRAQKRKERKAARLARRALRMEEAFANSIPAHS